MADNKLKIKKRTLLIIDWANVYGWSKTTNWIVCPKKLYHFFNRPKIVDKILYHGVEIGQNKSEQFKLDMENLGFSVVSKEVKWPPVLLSQQNHFKKIVKDLFNLLDKIKKTNSSISNKLYDLTKKIEHLQSYQNKNLEILDISNEDELKEIYTYIEEVDLELKNLNIDVNDLRYNLNKPVHRRKCDFDVEITRDAINKADEYDTLLLFSGDGDYYALTEDLIKKGKKVILVFAKGHKGKEYDNIKSSLFLAYPVNLLKDQLKLIKK
ncbi:MAG: hypothetical protein COX80_01885 [Candidatus Magasanikbacteria bacterium CG_4_10_14_0_2_um_filter_33_14]|uniref:NYN domain-containing protein n=1 Tax=Candidatus Magasanikbacteria bacterium CG_4_10_14_0_2_um_filter_33_14 TaxID=1974636 RepID=A0A2M7VB16_9BACT|nr:MAG: hypothetical protein COX80_01885 [Candidatus Magasanikbacteria bacterium CG_4_10_14_0_2_um_filter_33_14]